MSTPTVVNKKYHVPQANDIYIGRPSLFGNPFRIPEDGNREEVIEKYRELMEDRLNDTDGDVWIKEIMNLNNKNLVCWCKPNNCHGDVLVSIYNALMEGEEENGKISH